MVLALDPGEWTAYGSLAVSLALVAFALLQYKQTARKDYVDELTRKVDKCETERAELERERERLTRMTITLLEETRRMALERIERPAGHQDWGPPTPPPYQPPSV
jgi:hypothetical protein